MIRTKIGKIVGESKFFNLTALRRLYNDQGIGRGIQGKFTRGKLHVTPTHTTMAFLAEAVPFRKGGYGAPVVELGIRIVLLLTGVFPKPVLGGANPINRIAEELANAVLDRDAVVANLHALAEAVKAVKFADHFSTLVSPPIDSESEEIDSLVN